MSAALVVQHVKRMRLLPYLSKKDVKYLEIHLDEKLTWKTQIKAKRRQQELKLKNMNWPIKARSQLSLDSKLTVYKAILRPVWTYGIELWGYSKPSNNKILQTFQSKIAQNYQQCHLIRLQPNFAQ